MDERRGIPPGAKVQPEPTMVDKDGVWYSQEHKDYVMANKDFWEKQNKEIADPEAPELSDQYAFQKAYIKASVEDKRNCRFFKELPIESVVDEDAIKQAKAMGLTEPEFLAGKMTNELV